MLTNNSSAQPPPHLGPDGTDRRKQPRVSVMGGGLNDLIVADLADYSTGFVLDLGAGGMSVQVAGPVPPVEEFKLRFNLGSSASEIEVRARPAWQDGNGNAGLCFIELADECRAQLTEWLDGKRDQLHQDKASETDEPAEFDGLLRVIEDEAVPTAISTADNASVRLGECNDVKAPEIVPACEEIVYADIPAEVVATALRVTNADGAALALSGNNGDIICRASLGKAPKAGDLLKLNSGLSGECIRTGRVIACDDCSVDLRVPLAVSRDLGLQSIVVVPVFANGKTVGVLEVTSCAKAAFTSDHVAALQRLAKEASPISTSPVSLPRPSPLARFAALHDVAIPGAAITDRSRTPLNGDQEGAIGCASTADVELAGLSSDSAPVIDRQESPEDLISRLRAASFREAGQKPRGPQPTSFLHDKYAKVAATANSIIANPADFSRKSLVRAGRVPWLCGLVLIAGAILVGASVGWVLLVLGTPTDFTVRFMPPPVPRGRVQPIRAVPKATKSHSGDAGKYRDRRVELTERDAAKQLLSSVDPEYPQEAALRQISGAVSLTLLIDRSGSVEAIQDVSGNRILAAAAERAVRQWQFRRYLLHGQAAETLARVGFLFTLPARHL